MIRALMVVCNHTINVEAKILILEAVGLETCRCLEVEVETMHPITTAEMTLAPCTKTIVDKFFISKK